MKIGDSIAYLMLAALVLILVMLTVQQYIIPKYGTCVEKIDKHIHCTWGPFVVISIGEVE